MTTIRIEDLEIFANHGVLKEENTLGQKFILTIDMDVHTKMSDDINDTINYAEVCAVAEKFMQENTFNLIETAAAGLSREIMIKFPCAERVCTEIKKPWAPIKMNVKYVSAKTEQKWRRAYISMGSNLGDRRSHINLAVEKIAGSEFCRIVKTSDFIQTKPWGYVEQNDFLNACMEIETLYAPFELLEFLHGIEESDGRVRTVHWGPRTIDLDIIYYDNIVLSTPELTIPHREMSKRAFVLEPLMQIAPNAVNPLNGLTTVEMLNNLKISDKNLVEENEV